MGISMLGKQRRFGAGKTFAALFGTTALTFALLPTAAMAQASTDESNNPYTTDPTQVTLTKEVTANNGQVAPTGSYTFHFTCDQSDGPAIADQTVAVSNTDNNSVAAGTVSNFMPAASAFSHAGEYVYHVTENAGSDSAIQYDSTSYTMHIWISNSDNGLAYGKIIVQVDPGTPGNPGDEAKKIDPTPGTNPSSEVTTDDGSASQFVWTNKTSAVSNFSITKKIDGMFGNKDKDFPVTVTLNLASPATTQTQYKAAVGSTAYNFTVPAGQTSATQTVNMHDGSVLTFDASTPLPANTTYTVAEPATSNWVANGVATDANGVTASDAGTKSAAFTSATHTLAKGDGVNKYELTNTDQEQAGTGIIMNNLPFVVLGGAALVGIAYYTVSRKRREGQE